MRHESRIITVRIIISLSSCNVIIIAASAVGTRIDTAAPTLIVDVATVVVIRAAVFAVTNGSLDPPLHVVLGGVCADEVCLNIHFCDLEQHLEDFCVVIVCRGAVSVSLFRLTHNVLDLCVDDQLILVLESASFHETFTP